MEQKLNKEEIIKLISLYRSHDVLWNMSSKSYRRNDLKVKEYEDIASQMGMPADVVKKKIRSLRATYTGEKSKIYKKSGSATEEIYQSSLFWFEEMRFLDNSIAVRKSWDNSGKNSIYSQQFEDCIEEDTQNDSFSYKKTNKRPREEENSKFDEALKKFIDISDKENEFTAFATSIAFQFQKLPVEDAYELMGEMQKLLVERKLKNVRERRFCPITEDENNWCAKDINSKKERVSRTPIANSWNERTFMPFRSSSTSSSTAFSDVLNCAISSAGIEFD